MVSRSAKMWFVGGALFCNLAVNLFGYSIPESIKREELGAKHSSLVQKIQATQIAQVAFGINDQRACSDSLGVWKAEADNLSEQYSRTKGNTFRYVGRALVVGYAVDAWDLIHGC